MTVVKTYTANNLADVPKVGSDFGITNIDKINLIKTLVLCSDATYENGEGTGDPTEIALVV